MEKFLEENVKIIMQFRDSLNKETDRGCALMAASYLEAELEKLFKDKLVGGTTRLKELFLFNGPLSGFASKIKMSYCLGLLNQQVCNDLDAIRRIRNDFGHKYEPIDFSTEHIKRQILNLKLHFYEKEGAEPRKVFTNAVLGSLAFIHGAFLSAPKIKEAKDVQYTDEMKSSARQWMNFSVE